MTYLSEEEAGNDPVELYTFTYGDQTWLFTDGDVDYVHPVSAVLFAAEPISRGGLSQSDEDGSMSVEVTVDAWNPVSDFFRTPYLPARHVWLVIERLHRGSATPPAVIFRGLVGSVSFQSATAKLTCVPVRYAIGRSIPVQLVQTLCSNTLYDGRCKVDPAPFSIVRTIVDINALSFMFAGGTGHSPGYYSGGFIEGFDKPPATIKDDDGFGIIKMLYNPGYVEGDVITLYAGCDKKLQTCIQKFNNQPHFQAFPFMPMLDPFADEIA